MSGPTSFAARLDEAVRTETGAFLICMGLLYFGFWVFISTAHFALLKLPAEAYTDSLIFANLLHWKYLPFLALYVVPAYRSRKLRWTQLEHGDLLRVYCTVLALTLAYSYAGYGFNYYLDQAHLFDRALLLVLAVGVWRVPLLLTPLTCLCLVMHWQVQGPSPIISSFTDKLLPFHMLYVATTYVTLKALLPRW